MQSSLWGYWLVVMGTAIIGLMIAVQGITTNTTQDYYSTKEIVDASMLDAIDYGYYRNYNEIKISKEKFMEVFIRRLASALKDSNNTYQVEFYEIYEAPPKVSVKVKSTASGYDINSRVDAILQIFAEDGENKNNSNTGNNNSGTTKPDNGNNNSDNTKPDNGVYDPDKKRIPTKSQIQGFLMNYTYMDKYYKCNSGNTPASKCMYGMTLKEEYKNRSVWTEEIIKDWQEHYKITFTEAEKQEFRNVWK